MTTTSTTPGRLVAVDVLRGLTMAAMIVVNNPGSWRHMYPFLRHAAWGHLPLPADIIFPMFIFLMGVSVPLALGRRRAAGATSGEMLGHAARRSGLLFLVGIGLNLFPDFDLGTVRIPGVLQRIAVVYLACVVAWLGGGRRAWILAGVGLLAGYTALLAWAPVPGAGGPVLAPDLSLPVWLDETVLGAHTWRGAGDPEGILSTLPAVVTGLMGMIAGSFLAAGHPTAAMVRPLAGAGLGCLVGGLVWSRWLPPVKELWTGPYVLLTGGVALVLLAGGLGLEHRMRRWRALSPLRVLGRHALSAFAAAHLLSDLTIRVIRWPDGSGGTVSLHHFLGDRLLAGWLPPAGASLVQSLVLLVVVAAVLMMRERRRARA